CMSALILRSSRRMRLSRSHTTTSRSPPPTSAERTSGSNDGQDYASADIRLTTTRVAPPMKKPSITAGSLRRPFVARCGMEMVLSARQSMARSGGDEPSQPWPTARRSEQVEDEHHDADHNRN